MKLKPWRQSTLFSLCSAKLSSTRHGQSSGLDRGGKCLSGFLSLGHYFFFKGILTLLTNPVQWFPSFLVLGVRFNDFVTIYLHRKIIINNLSFYSLYVVLSSRRLCQNIIISFAILINPYATPNLKFQHDQIYNFNIYLCQLVFYQLSFYFVISFFF